MKMGVYISGDEARKARKEKTFEKNKAKVERFIDEKFTCIRDPANLNNEIFDVEFNKLMIELHTKFKPYELFAHGNNYISTLVEKLVLNGLCKIRVPQKLYLENFPSQFRNKKWFEQCIELCLINLIINQNILIQSEQDRDYRMTMLIMSAITNGGLNFTQGLLALINQLNTNEYPLTLINNKISIDLEIEDKRFPVTQVIDERELYIHRWYPDATSLAWIYNILQNRNYLDTELNYKEINSIVMETLRDFAEQSKLNFEKIKNIKHLCSVGIGITELIPGVKNLNQMLIGYATGKIFSPSIPAFKLKAIVEDTYVESDIDKDKEKDSNEKKDKQYKPKGKTLYSYIKSILSIINQKAPKIKNVITELKELLEEEENIIGVCFVNWLLHQIIDKNNSFNTIKNHFGYLGKLWLKATSKVVDVFNSESLNSYFSEIIAEREAYANKTQTQFIRELKSFHYYCYLYFDFPAVDIFQNMKTERTFIQTSFITEHLFKRFLKNIINRGEYEYMMCCFFIILYRSGFRFNEVRCLKIGDLDLNDEMYLTNKKNEYKSLKSYSARRKIALSPLLLDFEKKLLLNYVKNKLNHINVDNNSLLFSFDNTPFKPIGPGFANKIFNKCLSEKYDLPLSIHHLRHTAFNRLHIILENNQTLINQFIEYDENQLARIREFYHFGGKNSYWEIASFAGHSKPAITFTYYLHFYDLILHDILFKNTNRLDFWTIQSISGLSRQYLNPHLGAKGNQNGCFDLPKLYHAIFPSLSRYCNQENTICINNNEKAVDTSNLEFKMQPYDVFLFLQRIEKGDSFETVRAASNIEAEELQKHINTAKFLAGLKNIKSNLKLFTRECVDNFKGQELIVPREPSYNCEKRVTERILKNLIEYHEANPEDCKKVLIHAIKNTNYLGIVFNNPEDLKRLLDIICKDNALKKTNILIKYRLAEDKTIKNQVIKWKDAINKRANFDFKSGKTNNKISKTKLYPLGQAILQIKHPQEKYIIEASKQTKNEITQQTSKSLLLAIIIMAIFILDLPSEYDL